jgi:3-phenylpropionate/trans-cinnamate dioxygenase ferredoxin reductase subunit
VSTTPILTTLILGAGQAGAEVGFSLRQQGYAGRIVLIGDEPGLPYQRPPLSKGYLMRKMDMDELHLKPQAAYEAAAIELRTGLRAERVERRARRVVFADGSVLSYDALVLATGGRARPLQAPGLENAEQLLNLHYLRSIADVDRIHRQFHEGARLVLIGGGYVGLEVAAAARQCGLTVTVLEALPRVLARVTAPQVSAFYERVHREAGVDIRTGTTVTGIESDASGDAVRAVRCSDGSLIPADLVVVGIGQIPNTELAEQAGLAVDNGIVVDAYARTADPDVLAAGDCTNHPCALYRKSLRLESVPNALEQARTAAASICGVHRPHDAVPWFWSDQYDLKLQMVGLSQGHERVVLRGDPAKRAFIAFYLQDDHIVAADAINRPQEFMLAKRLVAQRAVIAPDRLTDESVPLRSIVPSTT